MGNTQTGGAKYSNAEIQQNIAQLFNNNKHNMVETNTSLSLDDTLGFTDIHSFTGGDISFQSSKNRHLRHNIQQYIESLQRGGVDTDNEFKELSELDEIKQYLEKDLQQQNQAGGLCSSEVVDTVPKLTLMDILKGGKRDNDSESSSDFEVTESSDDISPTSSNVVNNSVNALSPTSYSDKSPTAQYDTESSMDSSIDIQNNFIEESDSDLNVVPFYSSTTSDAKHPYVRNRFTK